MKSNNLKPKPPLESPAPPDPVDRLLWVMARLRSPDGGCPWDLEQDFKSIAPHTIEEAYEVADAIDHGDMDELKEELGDLLFQSVYHAQMAAEQGHFTFEDVVNAVTEKMISRHPHVFGDQSAADAGAVMDIWEAQKDKEKAGQDAPDDGALGGVTKGLPALLRASKLQKKAAKVGFEWADLESCFAKFEEELAELKAAETPAEKEDEIGDVLFCVANYARMQGINAEEALRKANEKFISRFEGMERDLATKDMMITDLSLDELLDLWRQQKSL